MEGDSEGEGVLAGRRRRNKTKKRDDVHRSHALFRGEALYPSCDMGIGETSYCFNADNTATLYDGYHCDQPPFPSQNQLPSIKTQKFRAMQNITHLPFSRSPTKLDLLLMHQP